MHRLKHIQDKLIHCVESQIECLDSVDAEEMGEVIDMIKDIEEAMYYHTITKAMIEGDEVRWVKEKEKTPTPPHHPEPQAHTTMTK